MAATASLFLNVQDIQKSLGFYRAIGFRVLKEYRDESGDTAWADLSLEGADLGLGSIASNDDEEFRKWVSTPLGAGVVVYFTVEDVDRYFRAAQDVGAVIEQPLTDRPYGRLFTLNDPDGYTITFLREPRARKASGKATSKKASRKSPKASTRTSKKASTKSSRKASQKAPKAAKQARREAPARKTAGRGPKAARGATRKGSGR